MKPINEVNDTIYYDYERQAWVKDGVYQSCAHPAWMACDCYGRAHAGEKAPLVVTTSGTSGNGPRPDWRDTVTPE